MIRSYLFAGLTLAAPVLAVAPAEARTQHVTGQFTPAAGVTETPSGSVTATLDDKKNLVTYHITWKGLSGPVMAAHFHGPADPGQDAGVLAPISGPYTSPLRGAVILTPEQVTALRAGRVYVNLHTAAHPDGEARAQLQVR
ncbi:CHRD domain containing protein [Gluconacetobacter diazotrophicus PA1 5]|nr:CHRD domain-containing protein [Gluconacetobacter diazotrophicus]ACI50957.1 CHRD domain containing protein [Gluconacetobacter diazotrophicus PA1 5]MBB2156108.1 CHRD domain-containing protein [Gluconacetobacter diazotrophicus]TWB08588.1 CHRD domain-containing protein [Gluconacetobacter diazotrophicus]